MLVPTPARAGLLVMSLTTGAFALPMPAAADWPAAVFEGGTAGAPQGKIDELVFGRLKELGIRPAKLCSDAVFIRRAFLDVIGTLPTAEEARSFVEDPAPGKRTSLVDRLLARDEFADYWAMKWSDLLRVKAEFPVNLWPHATQGYYRWIRSALQENLPYDQFARQLLTANGSNFQVPPVNFYRAMQSRTPQGIAQVVALSLMAARIERWPAERRSGLSAFFARLSYKPTRQWKEEIVLFDPAKTPDAVLAQTRPMFPDGTPAEIAADQDPRRVLADWLTAPGNPWFARGAVNRIWSWLLGRGIVHEPDDLRPDNPPSNPELLAWLEKELVRARYDLKHIYRLILNSQTYQLSSIPAIATPQAQAQFASYLLRRLEAEVLIDALCQVTRTTERYTSIIPEPFTFIPENLRSIALPDGSITSAFLEQFGRCPRDTGLESERNNRITAGQRLHLLNSSHIRRKIEQSARLQEWLQSGLPPPRIVAEVYLTVLSRLPSQEELEIVKEHGQTRGWAWETTKPQGKGRTPRGREALIDLLWALVNSPEFLYRH